MLAMTLTQATGVLLIVVGGYSGHGFSVTGTKEVMEVIPQMLRNIADEVERDVKAEWGNDGIHTNNDAILEGS